MKAPAERPDTVMDELRPRAGRLLTPFWREERAVAASRADHASTRTPRELMDLNARQGWTSRGTGGSGMVSGTGFFPRSQTKQAEVNRTGMGKAAKLLGLLALAMGLQQGRTGFGVQNPCQLPGNIGLCSRQAQHTGGLAAAHRSFPRPGLHSFGRRSDASPLGYFRRRA